MSVVVAADALNFARSVFLAAFVIFVGGAVLACSLALGLGGRDAVQRYLAERTDQPAPEEEASIWKHFVQKGVVMRSTVFGKGILFIAAIGGLTLTPVFALPQVGRGQGRSQPRYDQATETNVKGTIVEIRELPPGRGGAGMHLTLKTDKETLDVHLGPASFLARNQIALAKGDEVEVTGSKVKDAGIDALIARELKIGGKTLTLRDSKGIPQWSRSKRGRSR